MRPSPGPEGMAFCSFLIDSRTAGLIGSRTKSPHFFRLIGYWGSSDSWPPALRFAAPTMKSGLSRMIRWELPLANTEDRFRPRLTNSPCAKRMAWASAAFVAQLSSATPADAGNRLGDYFAKLAD